MRTKCVFSTVLLAVVGLARAQEGIEVQGAGSTLAANWYQDALFAYRYVEPNIEVSYTSMDSDTGVCRIESYATECSPVDIATPTEIDFAGSSMPLTDDDYNKYPDLQMYPTGAVAVVPVFNLPGAQQLVLSPTVLAQIYTHEVRTWDDSRIVALNPGFASLNGTANRTIEVVVRQDTSDSTYIYKSALASFYPTFGAAVPADSSANWSSLKVTYQKSYQALNAYIAATPWTIGYCTLDQALEFHLNTMMFTRASNQQVAASTTSLQYAVLELGPSFGNNGDPPERLTASLWNARGVNAWPLAGYTYIVLRTNTLRAGATCQTRQALVDFWQWFWASSLVENLAAGRSMVSLPAVIQNQVVDRFLGDMVCNGTTIWVPPTLYEVSGYGRAFVAPILGKLGQVYSLTYPQVNTSYTTGSVLSDANVAAALQNYTYVAFSYLNPKQVPNAMRIVFAGIGYAVVSRYNIVLDIPTLGAILEGTITTWLDPAIMALNPGGIVDADGNVIASRNQQIVLLSGPFSTAATWIAVIQRFLPAYTGKGLLGAQKFTDEQTMLSTVAGTPFSLGITYLVSNLGGDTQAVKIKRPGDGNIVAPTWQAVQSCASPDVYDADDNSFTLTASSVTTCYPLSDIVYLSADRSKCNLDTDPNRTSTISFLEWAASSNSYSALQQQNLAPLPLVSQQVMNANRAALQWVTCNNTLNNATIPLGPILGGSVGALCAIAIGAGFYVYHSTKQMREMRKKLSDDNVAEECAQAIACFDLEAVAWLTDLPKPSRIQQSFRQIVGLLTEVKPFIPDHLLAALKKSEEGAEAAAAAAAGPKAPRERHRTAGGGSAATRSSTASSSRSSGSGPRPGVVHTTTKGPNSSGRQESEGYSSEGSTPGVRGPRAHSRAYNPRLLNAGDFARRTCTFMYIKYSLAEEDLDEALRVTLMSQLAAHVITAGKAHAGTIDHVAFDSVAFHWNVSSTTATAPAKATSLALELAQMKTILPPERQAALRLSIGVGHGLCSVTTISAAGHRFFVVGGPAVSSAMDLVALGYTTKAQCSVLITSGVQHEVSYTAQCMPRLWFGDILLWEPLRLRRTEGPADEWMYELQNMEVDNHSGVDKAMLEVFTLAREGPPAAVRQKVRSLQQAHGAALTPRDQHSLNALLRKLGDE